jgi:hypothetical protein
MEQKSTSDAAAKDTSIKQSKKECALHMAWGNTNKKEMQYGSEGCAKHTLTYSTS